MAGGIFNFSLSDDVLGLGKMVAGSVGAKAQGTAECGAKPTCSTSTKSCKNKWEVYDRCTLASIEANKQVGIATAQALAMQQRSADATPEGPGMSTKTMILIGVGVLVLILLLRR